MDTDAFDNQELKSGRFDIVYCLFFSVDIVIYLSSFLKKVAVTVKLLQRKLCNQGCWNCQFKNNFTRLKNDF